MSVLQWLVVQVYFRILCESHPCISIVPPPVDSVIATNTSVSDTEVEVVVTWEPVEYVSVYFMSFNYYDILRLHVHPCTVVNI